MILLGITRKTPPMPLRSRKKLQRKRARPGDLVGEVGVVAPLELLAVPLGGDRPAGCARCPPRSGPARPGSGLDLAVVADHGRRAHARCAGRSAFIVDHACGRARRSRPPCRRRRDAARRGGGRARPRRGRAAPAPRARPPAARRRSPGDEGRVRRALAASPRCARTAPIAGQLEPSTPRGRRRGAWRASGGQHRRQELVDAGRRLLRRPAPRARPRRSRSRCGGPG